MKLFRSARRAPTHKKTKRLEHKKIHKKRTELDEVPARSGMCVSSCIFDDMYVVFFKPKKNRWS
jgi:hypothetical protein